MKFTGIVTLFGAQTSDKGVKQLKIAHSYKNSNGEYVSTLESNYIPYFGKLTVDEINKTIQASSNGKSTEILADFSLSNVYYTQSKEKKYNKNLNLVVTAFRLASDADYQAVKRGNLPKVGLETVLQEAAEISNGGSSAEDFARIPDDLDEELPFD